MRKNLLKLLLTGIFAILFMSAKAQKYEQPILISSAGQSADVKLVQVLAVEANLSQVFLPEVGRLPAC